MSMADAEVLTRRGWAKPDSVREGDETIGYNLATGAAEWTPISKVDLVEAPTVRMGHSRFRVTCSADHRWLNLPRLTVAKEKLPDQCHLCPWPNIEKAPAVVLASCPECGWLPKAPRGVALHRRRAHGVLGAATAGTRTEAFRRRGTTTEGGLRIHLAKAHGVVREPQENRFAEEVTMVAARDINRRSRIMIAAMANTESALAISMVEAELLGWIAGDGHVETRKHRPTMSIAQSKPPMVEKLKVLLASIPHADYVDVPKIANPIGPRHQFRLGYDYAWGLRERAGHPKLDAVQIVLGMSTEQRAAWLQGMTDAEGHIQPHAGNGGPRTTIAQCPGPVAEAIILAVYLSGHRPSIVTTEHKGQPNWRPVHHVGLNKPIVTGSVLQYEWDAAVLPAWDIQTRLESWTARHEGQVMLTGSD